MLLDLERHRMRLSGLQLEGHRIENADLRHSLAQSSAWKNVEFKKCRFSGSNWAGASFQKCTFTECHMSGMGLTGIFVDCEFIDCNLDQVSFDGSIIQGCKFEKCRAQFSSWNRATVTASSLEVDFRGANLNFAETKDVDFSGSNFWSALVPLNCSLFTDNTFSAQQVAMLAALMMQAKLPENVMFSLNGLTTAKANELVARMVRPGVSVEIPEAKPPESAIVKPEGVVGPG